MINTILDHEGECCGFGIQPRCPLYNLINNIQNCFGSKITTIGVRANDLQELRMIYDVEVNNNKKYTTKFLIEDFNIKPDDLIIVRSEASGNESHDFKAPRSIILKYNDVDISVTINKLSTVNSIKVFLEQNLRFVPGTVKISYKGIVLDDHYNIRDAVRNLMQDSNIFDLEGTTLSIGE